MWLRGPPHGAEQPGYLARALVEVLEVANADGDEAAGASVADWLALPENTAVAVLVDTELERRGRR